MLARSPVPPEDPMSEVPYVTITADTHAGAAIDAYRAYLDPGERDDHGAIEPGNNELKVLYERDS